MSCAYVVLVFLLVLVCGVQLEVFGARVVVCACVLVCLLCA